MSVLLGRAGDAVGVTKLKRCEPHPLLEMGGEHVWRSNESSQQSWAAGDGTRVLSADSVLVQDDIWRLSECL
jgi:hypothetical protein